MSRRLLVWPHLLVHAPLTVAVSRPVSSLKGSILRQHIETAGPSA